MLLRWAEVYLLTSFRVGTPPLPSKMNALLLIVHSRPKCFRQVQAGRPINWWMGRCQNQPTIRCFGLIPLVLSSHFHAMYYPTLMHLQNKSNILEYNVRDHDPSGGEAISIFNSWSAMFGGGSKGGEKRRYNQARNRRLQKPPGSRPIRMIYRWLAYAGKGTLPSQTLTQPSGIFIAGPRASGTRARP